MKLFSLSYTEEPMKSLIRPPLIQMCLSVLGFSNLKQPLILNLSRSKVEEIKFQVLDTSDFKPIYIGILNQQFECDPIVIAERGKEENENILEL